MKNVLVMGGSYFVGRTLVLELAGNPKYSLHVLNRGNAPVKHPGVTQLICDRNNHLQLKQTLEPHRFHTVIDFCAYTPEQVTSLLQTLGNKGVQHYILISSSAIYEATSQLPVAEDAPKLTSPQPELGPAAHYGFDKWRTEYASMARCKRQGIHYTHLRPCIIYGKFNYAPRESYFFDLIRKDLPVVLPKNDLPLFSFVHVRDVARAVILCLENNQSLDAVYNLAAPELIGYSGFVETIGQVMGKEVCVRKQSAEEINASRIPLPFPLDSHLLYSGEKICQSLGLAYTPLKIGLAETWEWFRQTQIAPDE
ncbi:MAG: NAD-dependent epimerase/dehydratase family protein [Desulfatibacillum sp.]|nr:NAD-dependent epimerase/dehydratase family protein [Desulfatibacillum sp.]